MKKIFPTLVALVSIFSCQQPSSSSANVIKAPIDSLINNWAVGWSNHDSAAVRNLFMADALLIDDNYIGVNAEAFSDKWIHPNINVVSNLTTAKIQDWSTNDRAGYTGKYALDVVVADSVIAKGKGVFTVNWIKTDKGDWKITTANIHSFIEKK
jgi:ketosteroid isomerase-like protein